MTPFDDAKAKLNHEQRQAVELIDGPVMVLAGPGTGKTQVLAFRIAEILTKTDVNPRNILALTFTESGVVAMRERLASLIGPTAYGVAIYTFHGFANRVINESGAEFYKQHNLEQIDDIRQFQILVDLMDTGQYPELRPPRAPYYYVRSMLSTIKSLKNEAITPDQLREITKEHIETLQNDPASRTQTGKKKGELKQTVQTKIDQLTRTLRLADVYVVYETTLTQTGRYDYEDMILFVVNKFRSDPNLLADYQERFLYLLVDEYQDTNNAQNELVRLLGQGVELPNLFVVGDDKQSIYRFQGASTANILNFRQWYPEATIITLKQNYRSGQPILDAAHTLIGHNTQQLANVMPQLDGNLVAQTKTADVAVITYGAPDQELLGLAESIKSQLAKGISPSDIAVIYRQNQEAAAIADILGRYGIAYVLEAGDDVLSDTDVQQLITLLHVAYNPDNDQALFRYLHAPYSGVGTGDLLLFSRWLKSNDERLYACLCAKESPEGLTLDWPTFQSACAKLEDWYRYSHHHNVGDVVEYVLTTSGLLPWLLTRPNHIDRLHRLRTFFDDVKRLAADKPEATLADLFARIQIRLDYRLPLIAAPLVDRADGAVRLMTAHKSKGLEFDTVYIPNCIDGLWSNGRARQVLALPDGLITHTQASNEEGLEEDRRLFYVALTRAKERVVISLSAFDSGNKKRIASQFLSEIGPIASLVAGPQFISPVHFFSPISKRFQEAKSREQLLEIMREQPLAPTSLNTFLTCPAEYLYRHVYKIPGVREPAQAYGTAIHRALEEWGKWSKAGDTYTLADILRIFMTSLSEQGLLATERAQFADLGQKVLTTYFEKEGPTWVAPLATEYSFGPHKVMLDHKTPLTGKLDKIEPIVGSTQVRVIDYKTGKVRSRNQIEGKTADSDGDYKRQLVFYAVLAEVDPFFPYKIGEVTLAFVDDDCRFTRETFVITAEEKNEFKQLLHSVYGEIIQLHFDHTPHKERFGGGDSLCDLLRTD